MTHASFSDGSALGVPVPMTPRLVDSWFALEAPFEPSNAAEKAEDDAKLAKLKAKGMTRDMSPAIIQVMVCVRLESN